MSPQSLQANNNKANESHRANSEKLIGQGEFPGREIVEKVFLDFETSGSPGKKPFARTFWEMKMDVFRSTERCYNHGFHLYGFVWQLGDH